MQFLFPPERIPLLMISANTVWNIDAPSYPYSYIYTYIKFLSSIAYIKPLVSAYLSLIPRVTTVLQFSLTEAQCGKERNVDTNKTEI